MSISQKNSFTPPPLPPLSPLLTLSREQVEELLAREIQLQQVGERLLEEYSSSRHWQQVAQVAQTLSSNSARIVCLRLRLQGFDSSSPYSVEGGMVEEGHSPVGPLVTVESIHQPPKVSSSKHLPYWSVKLVSDAEFGILRSRDDILSLSTYLSSTYTLPAIEIAEDDNLSPLKLQAWLTHALEREESRSDPLLQCFFSNKVENYSSIISLMNVQGESVLIE